MLNNSLYQSPKKCTFQIPKWFFLRQTKFDDVSTITIHYNNNYTLIQWRRIMGFIMSVYIIKILFYTNLNSYDIYLYVFFIFL